MRLRRSSTRAGCLPKPGRPPKASTARPTSPADSGSAHPKVGRSTMARCSIAPRCTCVLWRCGRFRRLWRQSPREKICHNAIMDTFDKRQLDKIRQIVLGGLNGHAARVYLFGSRARGDAWPWSDVDVAVDLLEPVSPIVWSDI